jgi:hypothetical protein
VCYCLCVDEPKLESSYRLQNHKECVWKMCFLSVLSYEKRYIIRIEIMKYKDFTHC